MQKNHPPCTYTLWREGGGKAIYTPGNRGAYGDEEL
ncbi:predicted protein [Plenodomus lingam JN3]|uniref:Predicted protein n=1 Tax=Leptosphaeria maculans (strain JN3 / isolate v23.1.3 / race Av1-4-5-6-7-8) TaxID=985895 RepID=E5AC96_LEPMJ|nr:predicted protein [Plenodomus lingam JN3]CBY02098.1 predicted protein [Plenodomus lingam JN3]